MLGGAESWVRGVALVDGGDHHLRSIDAQQIGRANTVLMNVADAKAASNNRLRSCAVGEAQPWREVILVGIHQRPVIDRSILRLDDGVCRGIEV